MALVFENKLFEGGLPIPDRNVLVEHDAWASPDHGTSVDARETQGLARADD